MKITFTGDSHVFHGLQHKAVLNLMSSVRDKNTDIFCNVGDIGEILINKDMSLIQELFAIQPTLFVAGNHDIYSNERHIPPKAMELFLNAMRYGIPLQTSWKDATTFFEKDDCLFMGTIGFPDFGCPRNIFPPKYYDRKYPTIDGEYINLDAGWLYYTRTMLDAFKKKLDIISSKHKNIVILTHYSCFESQYTVGNEDISQYFYCHALGEMIRGKANQCLSQNFYCVSGHGHDFNNGKWIQETPNLTTHGIKTTYYTQDFITLDL